MHVRSFRIPVAFLFPLIDYLLESKVNRRRAYFIFVNMHLSIAKCAIHYAKGEATKSGRSKSAANESSCILHAFVFHSIILRGLAQWLCKMCQLVIGW